MLNVLAKIIDLTKYSLEKKKTIGLLIVFLIIMLLLFYILKPHDTIKTTGPNSPIINQNAGSVNLNYGK